MELPTTQQIADFQKKIQNNPVFFVEKVLQNPIWEKQKEIIEAVRDNHEVAIRSCHASGKSYLCGRIVHWWLNSYKDSVVITTAPCFDKETEILTDNGWKLLSELKNEKVAQYNNGQIEFVKPIEYHKYPFDGELIGYKSQLIDMLVTPNHRLYVHSRWNKKRQIKTAEELYGKWDWRFDRVAEYRGKRHKLNNDWFEFYGFWFAEGYCERSTRQNRVVVTQVKNTQYVDDLFIRIGLRSKVKKDKRQGGGFNWTIYDKTMATEFVQYGKSLTKKIPRWILDASLEQLQAFYNGFFIGDGSRDLNGSEKLCTSSERMANDLHEICIKLGKVANLKKYYNKKSILGYNFEIKIWGKRGKNPQINGNHWYKKQYKDYVYCVKVPTQLIIVRRNGVVHISGNTFRQVKEVLWREIKGSVSGKKIYPEKAITDVKINISDQWFALGLATDKPDQFQGFHSPHLMVLIDEASGITPEIEEAIDGLTPEKIIRIGQPLQSTGRFADCFRMKGVKKMQISAFDTPNIKEQKLVIPGLITQQDIENFKIRYGEDSNVYRVRILGEFPLQDASALISIESISQAINRTVVIPQQFEKKMGVDVARFGDDRTAIIIRHMEKVIRKEVFSSLDTMEVTGKVLSVAKEEHIKAENIFIDVIGVGAGVFDRMKEQGWKCNAVNVACKPKDKENYINLRAELYAVELKEWLKTADLPDDDDFYELANIQYKFNSKGQLQLESKDDMKKRGLDSPDVADALMMTFASKGVINMPEQSQPLEVYYPALGI